MPPGGGQLTYYQEALASPGLHPLADKPQIFSHARQFKLRIPPAEGALHALVKQAHQRVHKAANYEEAMRTEVARLVAAEPPYWSKVWPAGLALGFHLIEQPTLVKGKSVLELGAGIGVGAVCAGVAGASHVIATDIEPKGLAFACQSANDNGTKAFRALPWNWNEPPPPTLGGPFDVVLAGDVIYEEEHAPRLGVLISTLVKPGGIVLFSDSLERPYEASHQSELCRLLRERGFVQTLCEEIEVSPDDAAGPNGPGGKKSGFVAAGKQIRLLAYTLRSSSSRRQLAATTNT